MSVEGSVRTNIDEYIHTGGDTVVHGVLTKDIYEITGFNRNIVIPQRTDLIARAILDHINPMDKTIIFCVDQDHALLMRDKTNAWKEVVHQANRNFQMLIWVDRRAFHRGCKHGGLGGAIPSDERAEDHISA